MRLRRTRVWFFFCVCLFPLQPQEAHKWTRAERKKCSENHPFDFNNWKSEFLCRTEAATRFNLDRPQSHTTTSANNTMNNHSFNVSLRWEVGNNDDDKWKKRESLFPKRIARHWFVVVEQDRRWAAVMTAGVCPGFMFFCFFVFSFCGWKGQPRQTQETPCAHNMFQVECSIYRQTYRGQGHTNTLW